MSRLVLVLGGFIWVFGWGFGDVIVMCSGVVMHGIRAQL